MNIQVAQAVMSFIALFIAYGIVATVAGSFRAWVAYMFGDDTGESLGQLSLDPRAHVDPLGVVMLLLLGFGWGRRVPINRSKMYGRFRNLKFVLAWLSDKVAYFVMSLLAILFLYFSFGVKGVSVATMMIFQGRFTLAAFGQGFPEASSFSISLGLIAVSVIFLSVLLIVFSIFLTLLRFFIHIVLCFFPEYKGYQDGIVLLVLFVIMFLGWSGIASFNFFIYLYLFVVKFLLFFANIFVGLFGA